MKKMMLAVLILTYMSIPARAVSEPGVIYIREDFLQTIADRIFDMYPFLWKDVVSLVVATACTAAMIFLGVRFKK